MATSDLLRSPPKGVVLDVNLFMHGEVTKNLDFQNFLTHACQPMRHISVDSVGSGGVQTSVFEPSGSKATSDVSWLYYTLS